MKCEMRGMGNKMGLKIKEINEELIVVQKV